MMTKRYTMKGLMLMFFLAFALVGASMLPSLAMAAAKGETLEVLNPFAERADGFYQLAPRLNTLDGKTIGLLNQNKANSYYYMDAVETLLKAKYSNIKFKHFIKRPTAKGGATWESLDYVWPKQPNAASVATHYHNHADMNFIKSQGVDAVINAVIC